MDEPTRDGARSPQRAALDPGVEPEKYHAAVRWSYLNQGARQGISLVISLVLAGLLGPRAFGVIALASVFLGLMYLLLEEGATLAVVQREHLENEHLDAAFWFVMAVGVLLGLIAFLTAPWWASVAKVDDLTPVVRALAVTLPLTGLAVIQAAILRRRLDFRSLTKREQSAMLIGGLVAILAALLGAGLWTLVIQQLVSSVVDVAMLWRISTWRPHLSFSVSHARDLVGFSTSAYLNAVGQFVSSRIEVVLIGVVLGPVAVSIYRLCSRLVNIVVDLAVGALGQVGLPGLAAVQSDRDLFGDRLTDLVRRGSLVAIPMLALLAAGSHPLIRLLGEEWHDAFPTMPILAAAAACTTMSALITPALQAVGRPGLAAARSWSMALVNAAALSTTAVLVAGRSPQTELLGLGLTRLAVAAAVWMVVDLTLFRVFCHAHSGMLLVHGLRAMGIGLVAALVGTEVARESFGGPLLAGALAGLVTAGILLAGFAAVDPTARRYLLGGLRRVSRGRLGAT